MEQNQIRGAAGVAHSEVAVRFSHVDAAGIVFYPRYIEMIAQAYPRLPVSLAPFSLRLDFLRPNRLGDRLALTCEQTAAEAWSICGQLNEREHFRAKLLSGEVHPLSAREHRPSLPCFRSETIRIGAWAAAATGLLAVSRYFECISSAVEQWFEATLDTPFRRLHNTDRCGIPTVTLSTRCRELPAIGDKVCVLIRPTRIGDRSLSFSSWLVRGEEALLETAQVVVFVRQTDTGFASEPWPGAIRKGLECQLA